MALPNFLLERIRPLLLLKGIGCMLFIVIFQFYFFILDHPRGILTELPLTWFDRVLPFQPLMLLPYVSLWAYVSFPAALAPNFR